MFPRVSGNKRRSDIKEAHITEFRVWHRLRARLTDCIWRWVD